MQNNLETKLIFHIHKAISIFYPNLSKKDIPSLSLEIPKSERHGDLVCNIAFSLSRILKRNPVDIANSLKDEILKELEKSHLKAMIEKLEIGSGGFINIFLSPEYYLKVLEEINNSKGSFGRENLGKRKKVQIEFVSANPTGPLSIAHGRQAAVGDSLARILENFGFSVFREYYLNDEGRQIELLGESIYARLKELLGEPSEFPRDGYLGSYIYDIAREIIDKKHLFRKNKNSDLEFVANFGVKYILNSIKKDLDDFGQVKFDKWYSQKNLLKRSKVNKAIEFLRKSGFIYDKDGAVWFRSTHFKDDKDRVVIKNDNTLTYLACDIAYHKEKFERGFAWLINLWGPDHHGYISRIRAAVSALGKPRDSISIIIVQLTTLLKGSKPIAMSTRKGEYITLRDVINEVGKDVSRFFFLMRRTSSHLDFDLDLAKKRSFENPVHYIQYAHARIAGILRNARFKKRKFVFSISGYIKEPEERALLRQISRFPFVLKVCLKQLDPCSLTSYLQELASLFHRFYDRHKVLTEDRNLSYARLYLISAVKIVISRGLNLIGVSVPERM